MYSIGWSRGRFQPKITRTFPFAEVVQAQEFMESNAQVGKIVVVVWERLARAGESLPSHVSKARLSGTRPTCLEAGNIAHVIFYSEILWVAA